MAEDFQLAYRLVEPGEEEKVRGLFEEVFRKPMSMDHWMWKYRNGLFGEAVNIVAVNGEGEIVGHFGAQPAPFQSGGTAYRAAQLMDGMLKRDYRAKGLYVKLCEEFFRICDERGLELVFGFPEERMFHVVCCFKEPFKADDIYQYAKDLRGGGKPRTWKGLADGILARLGAGAFRLDPMEAGDPRASRLWESFQRSCPVGIVRTRDYLRWRYDDHPEFRYLKLAMNWRGGGGELPVAYWVVREDGPRAWLLEGFCRTPLAFYWRVGLMRLESFLAARGVRELVAFTPRWHFTRRILEETGYAPSFQGRLAARMGPGTPREITRGWYFACGDHDAF